jgi:hypothetical protein
MNYKITVRSTKSDNTDSIRLYLSRSDQNPDSIEFDWRYDWESKESFKEVVIDSTARSMFVTLINAEDTQIITFSVFQCFNTTCSVKDNQVLECNRTNQLLDID